MPANPKLSSEVHLVRKRSCSSSVQNILVIQILTSNLVSVHNPEIPTHTSVPADRSLLSTAGYPLLGSYFSLIDACICKHMGIFSHPVAR